MHDLDISSLLHCLHDSLHKKRMDLSNIGVGNPKLDLSFLFITSLWSIFRRILHRMTGGFGMSHLTSEVRHTRTPCHSMHVLSMSFLLFTSLYSSFGRPVWVLIWLISLPKPCRALFRLYSVKKQIKNQLEKLEAAKAAWPDWDYWP